MYDKVDIYHELFENLRPDYPMIWATLEIVKPKVIAEYGAGSGRLLPLFKQTDAEKIIGLDLEKNMVKSFMKNGDDKQRIVSFEQNICDINNYIKDSDIVIMTSSVMKHIDPSLREKAWDSIYQSMGNETIVLIDHCEYIYDISKSTQWQSYFDTLKFWWAEEHREMLKGFEWKKNVSEIEDILYYKNTGSQEEIKIKTFLYKIDDLKHDIELSNLKYSQLTDKFMYPYSQHNTKRFISLLVKDTYCNDKLLKTTSDIKRLLNIEK